MRIFLLSLLLLAITAAVSPAAVTAPAPAVEPVLARLQKLAAGVTTLASDFIQEKHLAVFQEVLQSKGHFYFQRPDRLRWELTAPVASGFVLDGGRGYRWNARSGRTEDFSLDREPVMKLVAGQLFAWAGGDFNRLRQEYRISVLGEAPVVLRLEPLAATGGFLDHLRVAFAVDGRHVETVEVHEQDGDFTRIRFVNTHLNVPLPADAF
jgi:outer membrane lipoprotein-sorting protein